MRNFTLGFFTATIVLLLLAWFGRNNIIKWASIAYEVVEQPAVLLTSVELLQNGKEIGKIEKGAVLFLRGRAKDSPVENFSVSLVWETRGVDPKSVYRLVPKEQSVLLEMVLPQR